MKQFSPKNYELSIEPDFKTFKFSGKERVELEVEKSTDLVVLNAAELDVKEAHAVWKGKTIAGKPVLDEKKEELSIKLAEKVSGKVELFIDFVGTLNDRLIGLYRSEYKDEKGKQRMMATTQFEAADARRAFPCWDEPEAKATFDLSVIVGDGMTAISNMPVASQRKVGDKILFKFDTTPIMSTYLLYIGIGDFDFLEGKLGKILVRIVTTRGKKAQAETALDMTKKFLAYYQDYFGIPYPLPKLDMIAVPDFASGAMENWGAITFRETVLLFDEKTSSLATKQHIAEVVAHELAHQWFGNLVTMKWWNDLWLNESFATFMATKAVDKIYPEWDFWDQFLGSAVNQALGLDSLKTSHPIEVEVKNPGEIREIFDEISYEKGGSVLRMLEGFLGDEAFRAGLTGYLKKHKYSNATTEELWDSLASVSKQPIREMMRSWTAQIGYPVLDASVKGNKITLEQRRFLLEGRDSGTQSWMIPISVRMQDRVFHKLMDKKKMEIVMDTSGWFKANFAQNGLYRVKYGKENLEMLKFLISRKGLGNFDRWGVQGDLFALCVAGEARLKEYLDFVSVYSDDDDFLVSDDVAGNLYYTYLMSFGEPFSQDIKEHNLRFFEAAFDRLGWDPIPGEKPNQILLRSFVISALGRLGDEKILEEARGRFEEFLKTPDSLNPDIRSAVYSLVAWGGDEETFDKLADLYRKAPTQEEKTRFLAALSGFQEERLLQKALDFSLSDEVRSQDMPIPIARVSGNPYGRKLVWPWIKKNWADICKRFGFGSPLINRIIGTVSVLADAGREEEVAAFFKKNPMPGTDRKIAQTLETLRINSKFLERARAEFSAR